MYHTSVVVTYQQCDEVIRCQRLGFCESGKEDKGSECSEDQLLRKAVTGYIGFRWEASPGTSFPHFKLLPPSLRVFVKFSFASCITLSCKKIETESG